MLRDQLQTMHITIDQLSRQFVKVYVDDIITRSYTFTLHLHHLRQLFTTLRLNTVTLNPKKSFLGFPDVRLLGQHVDGFGLATL